MPAEYDSKYDVDVWLISLEAEGPDFLSEDEKLRAERFRFDDDRRRWTRARSALRAILADCAGRPANEIHFKFGPHGKPFLDEIPGIEFNISHSGVWAMVAVTRGVPVGIDIERLRENVDMRALLGRLDEAIPVDSASVSELFALWTRREAISKAIGGPLLQKPGEGFHAVNLAAPAGYCAAVATASGIPRVRLIPA